MSEARLVTTAELARALFEEIGDALFLLDPDTDRLIEVNPTALRLTGFTRAELLEFPATYLFRIEAAQRFAIDQKHAFQHAVLPHQIFWRTNLGFLFVSFLFRLGAMQAPDAR